MERGNRIKANPIDGACIFEREYLCQWLEPSKEYQEAYKLWLWYFYQCELYDSQICTGRNKYEDYMPASGLEFQLINKNAGNNLRYINEKRRELVAQGIFITNDDWKRAKEHFSRYKLKGLEEEYKHYFE